MRRRILLIALALGAILYTRAYCKRADLQYSYRPEIPATSLQNFATQKKNFSLSIGVPAHRTEKLIINNPAMDGFAILYIHGFGASRAEGEAVVDELAQSINANVYYARLPGHGTNAEAHAAATFDQYLQEMETAFLALQNAGRRVIVIGTSTGALIATHLGAKYPDKVYALILASPFWDFGSKTARLLNFPWGLELGEMALGKERDARWKTDPGKRQHADYYEHWLMKQKFSALVNLNNLRRYVINDEHIRQITSPVLGLVYYKNATENDDTIDIPQVRALFPLLGKAKNGGAKNRLVEIADGNHILLSEFVRTDKQKILSEITGWLKSL